MSPFACSKVAKLQEGRKKTLRSFSLKSYLALLIVLTLLFLTLSPASALTASRSKLFLFVQGINSSLTAQQAAAQGGDGTDPNFFDSGGLGTYLQSQGFSKARYLEYSYAPLGSTNTGQPKPYTCQDTYDYSLATHIISLSQQINSAVQNNPNTDVYIIAHSMGGIIAFGYLASLLEHVGNAVPLPRNGSTLKAVITLDSPLGGMTDNLDYKKLVFFRSLSCERLNALDSVAVDQMEALFQTATSSTAQGATASIVKAILNGSYLSNQKVANDAKRAMITVLTIGNTYDLLWRLSVCNQQFNTNIPDFSSTQWLQDEGTQSQVYSRMFASGFTNCFIGLLNYGNHNDVFYTSTVGQAIVQVVNGSTPSQLPPVP
jgi:triacylglycerol esterase/lipase EstA (alpha/beta hydrolase family)